jgi:hypothetical protein
VWDFFAAQCKGVPARQTVETRSPHPPTPKRKGSPLAVLGVDVGFGGDQFSDDSAIVEARRQV